MDLTKKTDFFMTTEIAAYIDKLKELAPFYPVLFTDIRKDLRDDHLRSDKSFFKRNFTEKTVNKVTVDELIHVYSKIIEAGYEDVAVFIGNRWVLRHLDIYNFFESRLKKIKEDFSKIDALEPDFAKSLLDAAVEAFGAVNTYIFSQLNTVAFGQNLMQELREMAVKEYARVFTSTT